MKRRNQKSSLLFDNIIKNKDASKNFINKTLSFFIAKKPSYLY